MKGYAKLTLLGIIAMCLSCGKSEGPEPLWLGEPTSAVAGITSQPIPGGSVLTYNIPQGTDVRYVKATYTIDNGTIRESKATIYNNSLTVDGYARAGVYDVRVSAVSVGEIESPSVDIKIRTLKPAHQAVLDSVRNNNQLYPTFGGINIDYTNPTASNLIMRTMTKGADGKWQIVQTTYTKEKSGRIRLRGYPMVSTQFAFYITDRWNNKSDTLIRTALPVPEIQFNKALFKQYNLASDTYVPHTGASRARAMPVLWDNIWGGTGTIFHTSTASSMPQWFTWDMGVKAKLSRFMFYGDANSASTIFGIAQPSSWELWGSNNPGADSWTKVGTYNSIKPSGLPQGQITTADSEQIKNGEEFEVDPTAGAYRYWRWKTISTWGGVPYVYFAEFSFFGNTQ